MRNKLLGIGEPGYHPVRKVRVVVRGLRDAVVSDFSVAYKLVVSLVVLAAAFILRSSLDFLLILVVTGFVLAMEIINTSLEALCDVVQDQPDERIRLIKDMAAAAAGIAIVVWLAVVVFEVGEMIGWSVAASA